MAEISAQLSPLEQQLLRFALEKDGQFCVSAAQLREAINTGEVDIPGKGPFSKDSALLEILETKAQKIGSSTAQENDLAEQICARMLANLSSAS
jgi:hypothetical protein